jgi:hypothetical protein
MEQANKITSHRFETLIVFGTITMILFPIRLFFVTYVTDNWFMSFGLIAIISLTLVVLAKKNKMGMFGQLFVRVMKKWNSGNRQYFLYIPPILLLIVSIGIISLINMYDSNADSGNEIMNFLVMRFGSVNEQSSGWMLHFYTVFLVEVLEVLGSMLFYRMAIVKMKTHDDLHSNDF